MKESLKNAIVNNIGRLVAGLLFTLILGVVTSTLIDPVKKVADLPSQVMKWQKKTDTKLHGIEHRQKQFFSSLNKQSQTDSVIKLELKKINKSNQVLKQEVSVIQAKIAIVRDELPVLHKRFNDIENTVNNLRSYSAFSHQSTLDNQTTISEYYINPFDNCNALKRHKQHCIMMRSKSPQILYLDSLNNIQSNCTAYQLFNSN